MSQENAAHSETTVSVTQYVQAPRLSFQRNESAATETAPIPTKRVTAGDAVSAHSNTPDVTRPMSTARSPRMKSAVATMPMISSATAKGQRSPPLDPDVPSSDTERFSLEQEDRVQYSLWGELLVGRYRESSLPV